MCLMITLNNIERTKIIKAATEPIFAYKVVSKNYNSILFFWTWPTKGPVVSDREDNSITPLEIWNMQIDSGLHFFEEKPKECTTDLSCHYHPFSCGCGLIKLVQFQCREKYNKILKVEIQPKDLISFGTWRGENSLVATKCTVIGEDNEDI